MRASPYHWYKPFISEFWDQQSTCRDSAAKFYNNCIVTGVSYLKRTGGDNSMPNATITTVSHPEANKSPSNAQPVAVTKYDYCVKVINPDKKSDFSTYVLRDVVREKINTPDDLRKELNKQFGDFIYGGFSSGLCEEWGQGIHKSISRSWRHMEREVWRHITHKVYVIVWSMKSW